MVQGGGCVNIADPMQWLVTESCSCGRGQWDGHARSRDVQSMLFTL